MKPSTNKEECTIDLTADEIPFSCIVDGNESITKWQIKIYDITNNEEVFKTEEITLESSFYPVDEKNRNVVFVVDLKKYLEGNTAFINRSEAYYWTITLWGSSGYTTTSYQEVFYANETPIIGFNLHDGDTLISKDYTFRATYEQKNGVQLKRYGWRITDTDSGQVLVDTITKNQIYGSADNIICKYDGFLNGSNYSVELYIETQNNTKITSSLKFSVSYATTFLSSGFKVETLKNEPAIMLDWNKALVINGVLKEDVNEDNVVSVDNTTFKTNFPVDSQSSIEIPEDFKVVYDDDASLNFDINENSYIAFSTQLLSDDSSTIKTLFLAEGTEIDDDGLYDVKRQLSYGYDDEGNRAFIYEAVSRDTVAKATHRIKNKPSEYVWYNIFMSPLMGNEGGEYTVELNVYEGKVINCIYPSEDLYPRVDFYPVFGNWDNLKEE